MQALSPKALCSGLAMEPDTSSELLRSASLPSRPPPPPSPMPVDPCPPSHSITRPYRLFPSASRGVFPSSPKPSALLQRRLKANQGLYPVDRPPAAGSTDNDSRDPSPPPSRQVLPSDANRKPLTAYEILHVLPSASQQEIKASFWRLARQHHPDKAPAEQREASSRLFLQIHSAYNTLRDPQCRARYDLELSFQYSPVFETDLRKPQFCSPSPRIFATHGQSFTTRTTANAYTPWSQLYTPRSTSTATPTFTPRTPYSGRNWETDQCW